ncbi:tartrate-resistant acid phosphatase type 5-like [Rhopilema esculentum]|uniref:tartrate-resistant acid phosphatase type 5-like n=1 Tax=Rhopilema esculentum TaxID=499914 RepID=UPI0031D3D5FC|eukprot:gene566-10254_t
MLFVCHKDKNCEDMFVRWRTCLVFAFSIFSAAKLLEARRHGYPWNKDNELNFLVLGDWGGSPSPPYRTPIEVSVADMMAEVSSERNSQFVVALGDNFYFDGVEDDSSIRFEETFEKAYAAKSLQIPWYVIAGNHDHHRNVSGQIDYTRLSKRWNFPNFYHSHIFNIPGSKKTLQIILIDTVLLCGNSGHDFDPRIPTGPDEPNIASEQLDWIEKTLASSKSDYILVGGHYPVWSIGHHGPTSQLVEQLKPMLEKYKVNAYICGHDHNLQSIKESDSEVLYHVIGNANFLDPRTTHESSVPDGSSKFFYADNGGFAAVTVNDFKMVFQFVNSQGRVVYESTSTPRL